MIRGFGVAVLIAAFVSAFSTTPAVAHDQQISGTYTGTAHVYPATPLGPYSGYLTANVGQGSLAGSTVVAVYSVSQVTSNHLDPGAVNVVVIWSPSGALVGVATSYQFSPDPPCAGVGCVTKGAVLTIHVTGGTGRFKGIEGGALAMTQDATDLDNGFPGPFVQSMTGTISGSLER